MASTRNTNGEANQSGSRSAGLPSPPKRLASNAPKQNVRFTGVPTLTLSDLDDNEREEISQKILTRVQTPKPGVSKPSLEKGKSSGSREGTVMTMDKTLQATRSSASSVDSQ